MKKSTLKSRAGSAAFIVALSGIGVVAFAAGAAASGLAPLPTPVGVHAAAGIPTTPMTVPSYKRNASGETYGSAAKANSVANEPDLIAVQATNGVIGFARKADLESGESFTSPAEALAWQAADAGKTQIINVYGADGTTVVGTFDITPSVGQVVKPSN
jgi:hypothetical protein